MMISAGRLAVIQPDRLSPGSTATASKPADTAALRSRSASYGPEMISSFIRRDECIRRSAFCGLSGYFDARSLRHRRSVLVAPDAVRAPVDVERTRLNDHDERRGAADQ